MRLRLAPFMDFIGLKALQNVVRKLQRRCVLVMHREANHRVRAKLCTSGVFDPVADGDYADDVAGTLRRLPERSA